MERREYRDAEMMEALRQENAFEKPEQVLPVFRVARACPVEFIHGTPRAADVCVKTFLA